MVLMVQLTQVEVEVEELMVLLQMVIQEDQE
jgi:hypothetical protein